MYLWYQIRWFYLFFLFLIRIKITIICVLFHVYIINQLMWVLDALYCLYMKSFLVSLFLYIFLLNTFACFSVWLFLLLCLGRWVIQCLVLSLRVSDSLHYRLSIPIFYFIDVSLPILLGLSTCLFLSPNRLPYLMYAIKMSLNTPSLGRSIIW